MKYYTLRRFRFLILFALSVILSGYFCSASFAGNISIGGEGLAFTIPAGYYTILHGEMNKDTEKFLKSKGVDTEAVLADVRAHDYITYSFDEALTRTIAVYKTPLDSESLEDLTDEGVQSIKQTLEKEYPGTVKDVRRYASPTEVFLITYAGSGDSGDCAEAVFGDNYTAYHFQYSTLAGSLTPKDDAILCKFLDSIVKASSDTAASQTAVQETTAASVTIPDKSGTDALTANNNDFYWQMLVGLVMAAVLILSFAGWFWIQRKEKRKLAEEHPESVQRRPRPESGSGGLKRYYAVGALIAAGIYIVAALIGGIINASVYLSSGITSTDLLYELSAWEMQGFIAQQLITGIPIHFFAGVLTVKLMEKFARSRNCNTMNYYKTAAIAVFFLHTCIFAALSGSKGGWLLLIVHLLPIWSKAKKMPAKAAPDVTENQNDTRSSSASNANQDKDFSEVHVYGSLTSPKSGKAPAKKEMGTPFAEGLGNTAGRQKYLGPILIENERPNESDYGYSPRNPICSNSPSVTDAYLSRLRTAEGKSFTWTRNGSLRTKINNEDVGVDIYALFLDGVLYKKLYVVPYCISSPEYPPYGLVLNTDQINKNNHTERDTAESSQTSSTMGHVKTIADVAGGTAAGFHDSSTQPPLNTREQVNLRGASEELQRRLSKMASEGSSLTTDEDEPHYWEDEAEEEGPAVTDHELFRDITQDVAVFMYQAGITRQPGLSFFTDDRGIFEGLFIQHITNRQLLQMKKASPDVYLHILGMHFFGAGVYVTGLQARFGHGVQDFTKQEVEKIAHDFEETDAYELALKQLSVPLDSKNKQVLDRIIMTGIASAKNSVGSDIMEVPNLKVLCQVLYNAGISMYMMR